MTASDFKDARLAEALAECQRLRDENRQLRGRLGMPLQEVAVAPATAPAPIGTVTAKSRPEEKVKLFFSLFRGREDVHAVRWEGRNGKAGYSPACRKVWGKPFPKHADEPKEYFPLTDQVIHDHLMGKLTAGVYTQVAHDTGWC